MKCFCLIVLLITQHVLAAERNASLLTAGAVASPDYYGAVAAQEILKKGGNAVDAAVATAFVLAVTYPEAGNIGGGGFMTLWLNGQPYFLDYREVAPAKAIKDMYLDDNQEVVPNLSLYSYKAAGVPGTVAGMWAVHQRFGELPWEEVIAPSIHYATKGFKVNQQLIQRYQEMADKAPKNGHFKQYFGSMKVDQLFKQPELAKTLERIAKEGSDGFYKGETASLIAEQMTANEGLITKSDLANYKAKWRAPLIADWQGMQIIPPPPLLAQVE